MVRQVWSKGMGKGKGKDFDAEKMRPRGAAKATSARRITEAWHTWLMAPLFSHFSLLAISTNFSAIKGLDKAVPNGY